jgi:predicted GTPase
MAKDREQGRIFHFSPRTQAGTIRLHDGRLVELSKAAVVASGVTDLGLGDDVSVCVNVRFGRSVATSLVLDRSSRKRSRPDSGRHAKRTATNELDIRERIPGETRIMLVGRTGVGKSSTINTLLGAEVAKTGEFEPETASICIYRGRIGTLRVLVIDTPGLCDDRADKGNDRHYIEQMVELVGEIDLMLFATTIDDSRVRSDEIRCLDLLTQCFGAQIWDNTVTLLTRSDLIARADFERVVAGRSKVLRSRLEEIAPGRAAHVPFVPVSNVKRRTPDRRRWLPTLWIAILERLAAEGFVPLLLAIAGRLEIEESRSTGPAQAASAEDAVSVATPPRSASDRKRAASVKKISTMPAATTRPRAQKGSQPTPSTVTPHSQSDSRSARPPSTSVVATIAPPRSSSTEIAPVANNGAVIRQETDQGSAAVFTPMLEDILPAETDRTAPSDVHVERVTERTVGGVHVVMKDFVVVTGGTPVVANGKEASAIREVAEARAPGLLRQCATAAGKWLATKLGALLGF